MNIGMASEKLYRNTLSCINNINVNNNKFSFSFTI